MKKTKLLRKLWYDLSSNQRFFIRRLYYLPQDLFDKITGKTHKYVPPRGFIYTGSPSSAENYLKQGELQLELLKEEINLIPSDSVLDIGSGVGRTAIALTTYINEKGSYDGFDVVKKGIDWCNSGIGTDFSNFNFKYVALYNDLYNTSASSALEFVFPYGKNSFNKIFTFSVFTHMMLEEIQHYFNEIQRVITNNGLCFSTFFLYDSNDEDYIATRKHFNFPVKGDDGFRLMNKNVKSGNIAIHKTKLDDMLKNANLKRVKRIDGFWKDEVRDKSKKEYQDIVVFKRI
ncbi:methyltransferase domain-containing protein [Flavivirga amylovorans]|uniref:Methyltransferase domain-containing protein n=1 Tax=Flavivirga amylovorans TaxID=870486 RepID=A0ABT8X3F1_9FLAO|nr:class I SAM-dependent methyltransferase [Flavivirga amylovorans]MDO5988377.1 methyltransferase domain-containing protein [Flavivirga amylovorans]